MRPSPGPGLEHLGGDLFLRERFVPEEQLTEGRAGSTAFVAESVLADYALNRIKRPCHAGKIPVAVQDAIDIDLRGTVRFDCKGQIVPIAIVGDVDGFNAAAFVLGLPAG